MCLIQTLICKLRIKKKSLKKSSFKPPQTCGVITNAQMCLVGEVLIPEIRRNNEVVVKVVYGGTGQETSGSAKKNKVLVMLN